MNFSRIIEYNFPEMKVIQFFNFFKASEDGLISAREKKSRHMILIIWGVSFFK